MSKSSRRLRVRIDGEFHVRPPRRKLLILSVVVIAIVILRMTGDNTTVQLFF